jgi:crossover junction endodeoxyribonuclease RuvC
MMRIMGIDPGTRVCGYGVIDLEGGEMTTVDYGVARGQREAALPERLGDIYKGLSRIIEKYSPEVVAIEGAFYGTNPRTAIKIGEGRGVALLSAANAGIKIVEYSPATVKKAVTGSGRAKKNQVQQMVRIELGLSDIPRPDDAADALAIAICHCHRKRLEDI